MRLREREQCCQELLLIPRQAGRTEPPLNTHYAQHFVASAHWKTGNRALARLVAVMLQEPWRFGNVLGPDHPDYAASLNDLALFFWWDFWQFGQREPLLPETPEGGDASRKPRSAPESALRHGLTNLALYRAMHRHPRVSNPCTDR